MCDECANMYGELTLIKSRSARYREEAIEAKSLAKELLKEIEGLKQTGTKQNNMKRELQKRDKIIANQRDAIKGKDMQIERTTLDANILMRDYKDMELAFATIRDKHIALKKEMEDLQNNNLHLHQMNMSLEHQLNVYRDFPGAEKMAAQIMFLQGRVKILEKKA